MGAILAAVMALSCAEAAEERDQASGLYIAAAMAEAQPGLAARLGKPVPSVAEVVVRINGLDARLAECGRG